MRKLMLKRLWLLVPGALALALTALCQTNATLTEELFSCGVYPWLSSAVAFLPSLVEFSVAQWVVIAFVLFCLGFLAYYLARLIRGKGERGMIAWRAVTGALAIVSVTYFGFTMLCGLNYYRCTFAEAAGFEICASSPEELVELCTVLAADMNEARAEIGVAADALAETENPDGEATGTAEDIDAYAAANGGFAAYAHQAVRAMEKLAQTYDVLARPLYSPPKPVLFSELMSYADIAGMYFPFTVESNINADAPFFTLPATMAHELAHQCGFMREDEANFIAYLACKDNADPLVRYSGLSLAYDYASAALASVNREAYLAIYESLSEEVRADRNARSEFWARYEGPVAEMSNAANNTYLRANGQSDGTASYGRMVDLLLAEQRAARA